MRVDFYAALHDARRLTFSVDDGDPKTADNFGFDDLVIVESASLQIPVPAGPGAAFDLWILSLPDKGKAAHRLALFAPGASPSSPAPGAIIVSVAGWGPHQQNGDADGEAGQAEHGKERHDTRRHDHRAHA